ncbi:MAG: ABC transporter substrate-binding protein [Desulfovibrionaceae bacterium]|nr:ABC transporter substrate-binding protein [Desulfovibrionaceae bacterium]
MMKRRFAALCPAILLAALCVGGAFAAEPAQKGNDDITIVQALDIISFDPTSTSDLNNQYVLYNLYSRLFTFPANRLAGDVRELCKDFKMVSENEWHFTLWDKVQYHDGSTMTVDDVVHSLNRAKAGRAVGALFRPVKAIAKINDNTLSITTDGPYPGLPSALTHAAAGIVPKAYAEKAEQTKDWSKPIGSGRYAFVKREIGDSVTFERFDGYFNKEDLARNRSLTIKVISEDAKRTAAVESGAADLNAEFVPVEYERVVKNPKLKLWEQPSALVWHLGMDNTHEWFKHKLVRQAAAFAVDRDACMQAGHQGRGSVLYNSATFAHAPTVLGAVQNPLNMYSHNVAKAKELMQQAGCPGFSTQLVVFRDEAERVAAVIQANLAVINIRVEIVRIENALFAAYIASHKAPLFVTSWGCYWDPDMFLARRFSRDGIGGVNRVWYQNPKLDEMIMEGRRTVDEAKRYGVYKKIQEFLAEESPEVDLYVTKVYALSNDRLKGVEMTVERPYNYHKLHY